MSLWRRLGTSGRNLAATAGAEVVVRLVGLAYLMVLARYLAPEAFGSFNTLLAYFALAVTLGNFGLDQLALRHLSVASASSAFPTLLRLRIGAALATAALLLVLGRVLATPSAALFTPLAVAVLPAGVASALAASFKARERFGVPSAAAAVSTLTMAGVALGGVVAGEALEFFLWALVAAEVVRAVWLAVAAAREGHVAMEGFDPAYATTALRSALPYAALAVLGVIYFRIDLIMLDAMVGGDEVGHYASAYRVLEALVLAPGLVLAVLFPRFARGQAERSGEARDLYLGVARILFWAGIVVGALGVVFAEPILTVLFSDRYVGGTTSLVWLMVALAFVFWHAPNVTALFSGDRLGPVVALSLITAGFNVAVNWVLIPRYGASGAAAATAGSELLSWAVFTPMVLRRLEIGPLRYLGSILMPRMSRAELRVLLGDPEPTSSSGGTGAR